MQAALPNPTRQDLLTLARTIWGEARGESTEGQIAVAQVVMNRWEFGPDHYWNRGAIRSQRGTIQGTCLTRYQFSCWNDNDPNLPKLQGLDEYRDATFRHFLTLARLATCYLLRDLVEGATHYHTKAVSPFWAERREPVVTIGEHHFYRGIR
ncbi:MAG: cell wall hydrolase [Pseudomonadota bacterium]